MAPVDRSHFLGCCDSRPDVRRGRRRRCLLKGCERPFWPSHPQARYCSKGCQQAARRWRRWQSGQRYRSSAHGQERRREQSRRYRQRRAAAERAALPAGVPALREGQRPAPESAEFYWRRCERPGCYKEFAVGHEHSPQRFCSVACRLALRRVLDREARYRQRRRRWRREQRPRHCPPPDTS